VAVEGGHFDLVKYFLERKKMDIEIKESFGVSAIRV